MLEKEKRRYIYHIEVNSNGIHLKSKSVNRLDVKYTRKKQKTKTIHVGSQTKKYRYFINDWGGGGKVNTAFSANFKICFS